MENSINLHPAFFFQVHPVHHSDAKQFGSLDSRKSNLSKPGHYQRPTVEFGSMTCWNGLTRIKHRSSFAFATLLSLSWILKIVLFSSRRRHQNPTFPFFPEFQQCKVSQVRNTLRIAGRKKFKTNMEFYWRGTVQSLAWKIRKISIFFSIFLLRFSPPFFFLFSGGFYVGIFFRRISENESAMDCDRGDSLRGISLHNSHAPSLHQSHNVRGEFKVEGFFSSRFKYISLFLTAFFSTDGTSSSTPGWFYCSKSTNTSSIFWWEWWDSSYWVREKPMFFPLKCFSSHWLRGICRLGFMKHHSLFDTHWNSNNNLRRFSSDSDAIRDVSRYTKSFVDLNDVGAQAPAAEVQFHMKLFRAQRNFYIAGFALFLF